MVLFSSLKNFFLFLVSLIIFLSRPFISFADGLNELGYNSEQATQVTGVPSSAVPEGGFASPSPQTKQLNPANSPANSPASSPASNLDNKENLVNKKGKHKKKKKRRKPASEEKHNPSPLSFVCTLGLDSLIVQSQATGVTASLVSNLSPIFGLGLRNQFSNKWFVSLMYRLEMRSFTQPSGATLSTLSQKAYTLGVELQKEWFQGFRTALGGSLRTQTVFQRISATGLQLDTITGSALSLKLSYDLWLEKYFGVSLLAELATLLPFTESGYTASSGLSYSPSALLFYNMNPWIFSLGASFSNDSRTVSGFAWTTESLITFVNARLRI